MINKVEPSTLKDYLKYHGLEFDLIEKDPTTYNGFVASRISFEGEFDNPIEIIKWILVLLPKSKIIESIRHIYYDTDNRAATFVIEIRFQILENFLLN